MIHNAQIMQFHSTALLCMVIYSIYRNCLPVQRRMWAINGNGYVLLHGVHTLPVVVSMSTILRRVANHVSEARTDRMTS